jgi:hypothetical protein
VTSRSVPTDFPARAGRCSHPPYQHDAVVGRASGSELHPRYVGQAGPLDVSFFLLLPSSRIHTDSANVTVLLPPHHSQHQSCLVLASWPFQVNFKVSLPIPSVRRRQALKMGMRGCRPPCG